MIESIKLQDPSEFIAYYSRIRQRTDAVVRCILREHIEWSLQAGRFTLGDIVRHLASIERFMYAENARGRPSRYPGHGRELADGYDAVLDYFARLHSESMEIFSGLSVADFNAACLTPGSAEIRVWKWLRAMVEHEIHHRAQIYVYLGILGVKTPPLFGVDVRAGAGCVFGREGKVISEDLSGFISAANAITDEVRAGFGGFTARQLNWKPSADQWSIAQCFDHLVTTNGTYFPSFEQVISGEKKNTFWEIVPGLPALWGKMLIKAADPESKRKLKAPKAFHPLCSSVDGAVICRFIDQQNQVIRYMKATEGLDVERIIISSPVTNLVTHSLMDAYRTVVSGFWMSQMPNLLGLSEFVADDCQSLTARNPFEVRRGLNR